MNFVNIVSKQATNVYSVVAKSNIPLSVKEISKELGLLAPAVHRSIKQLVEIGVVQSVSKNPAKYTLASSRNAAATFIGVMKSFFVDQFPASVPAAPNDARHHLTAIRDRSDLLKHTDNDVRSASETVDFIVSGLEVPDETILAYRGALLRGVCIRAIIQQQDKTPTKILENWLNIGVQARSIPSVELRIFVIDHRIAYVTSYNEDAAGQALGIRFEYAPLAEMLSGLFEEQWQNAEPILQK